MKADIYTPQAHAWRLPYDQPLYDEQNFTPWAKPGWNAWNGMSPEAEIVQFAAGLVRLIKPALVVETGVGQGYMTRAIARVLSGRQRILCYESDRDWKALVAQQDFWSGKNVELATDDTPPASVFSKADFVWLDSDFAFRLDEIERWHQHAKPRSVVLIHDTGERHAAVTMHQTVKEKILALGLQGLFLHNPRGSFLAVKQ